MSNYPCYKAGLLIILIFFSSPDFLLCQKKEIAVSFKQLFSFNNNALRIKSNNPLLSQPSLTENRKNFSFEIAYILHKERFDYGLLFGYNTSIDKRNSLSSSISIYSINESANRNKLLTFGTVLKKTIIKNNRFFSFKGVSNLIIGYRIHSKTDSSLDRFDSNGFLERRITKVNNPNLFRTNINLGFGGYLHPKKNIRIGLEIFENLTYDYYFGHRGSTIIFFNQEREVINSIEEIDRMKIHNFYSFISNQILLAYEF